MGWSAAHAPKFNSTEPIQLTPIRMDSISFGSIRQTGARRGATLVG